MTGEAPGPRPEERVGFIGLGSLGTAIARRLADAGRLRGIWNRTPGRASGLAADGVHQAVSPAALMRATSVVILCVSDASAVEEVTFGPTGLAEGTALGKIVIDHSSISPHDTRNIAARLADRTGTHWLDAPVSGGPQGAAAGTLTVLAGGSQEDFRRVEPVLAAYAGHSTLIGPTGAGQATKLCNQVIVAATCWGLAEATLLATTAGIDPTRLPEYLEGGFADSPLLHVLQPLMTPGNTTHFGSRDYLLKDLDAALRLARSANCPMPVTAHAAELFRTARKWSSPLHNGGIIDLLSGPQPDDAHPGPN
ncbi:MULTISPECIES: NAD(P)-dependent oxidoreductase [Streptomyces]|uniref:NAD(P)-dependent oxidoreductase n=1 Tax=Streptomyces TaxID=1883 RepID=UPI0004CC9AE1|nr:MULTISPECIES: NAD(P)-dependent oxidoreductase [Streptomyces]KOT48711.1 2-hydroxy-3-oxopropionate reductase [Streptomyces rimosus subsp. rimosus]